MNHRRLDPAALERLRQQCLNTCARRAWASVALSWPWPHQPELDCSYPDDAPAPGDAVTPGRVRN